MDTLNIGPHSLKAEEYEVQTMEIQDLKEFRESFSANPEFFDKVVLQDPWVYYITYNILKAGKVVGRINHYLGDFKLSGETFKNASGEEYKFKNLIRAILPEVSSKIINAYRKLLGDRDVTKVIHPENVWFCTPTLEMNICYNFPSDFDVGSEVYTIWKNLAHLAKEHHTEIKDSINMTDNNQLGHFREELLRISGEVRLKKFHDMIVDEYNKIQALIKAEQLKKPFPEQNIPNDDGIVYLSNGEELLREGQDMHHCVASYVDSCMKKNSYIYRIEREGKRGTLELRKDGTIAQFRSSRNSEPDPILKSLVGDWIKKNEKHLKDFLKAELGA